MAYTVQGGSDVFTKLLEKAGMENPFDENVLRKVCAEADAWLTDYDLSDCL